MTTTAPVLYYVHDPMCSWCWAFRSVWREIRLGISADVRVRYLLGGLAPDTDAPMPRALRTRLQATWRQIQKQVPGTAFNFDFWKDCQPRRSTYPACRAVIAARRQDETREDAMIHAIQTAYYREARNPSDAETLMALAGDLGLDVRRFAQDLISSPTQRELLDEIDHARRIGGRSFPSLFLELEGGVRPLGIDYLRSAPVLQQIRSLLSMP